MGANKHGESVWLIIPHALVIVAVVSVALTMVLLPVKLHFWHWLHWWIVFLPIALTLAAVLTVLSISIVVWIHVACTLCAGEAELEVDPQFRLDMLFRTAKICFLGHGYVAMLCLGLGLLILKLELWTTLSVVYPLLPLIVLGTIHLFLGIMLKEPELDAEWSFFTGASLLSQSICLVLKLKHFSKSSGLPWGAAFCPSWITYALLLVYCVRSAVPGESPPDCRRPMEAPSIEAGAPMTTPRSSLKRPPGSMRQQLFLVGGLAVGVLGFSASQVLLTVRLDGLSKISMPLIFVPALIGWIAGAVFMTGHVSNYFTGIARLLLDTFNIVPFDGDEHVDEPLLPPWR